MKRIFAVTFTILALAALPATATNYTTGDAEVAIPDNSAGVITACQTITVADADVIADVAVEITARHTWVGDVTFQLTSPGATTLTVVNRPGRSGAGSGNSDDYVTTTPFWILSTPGSGLTAENIGDDPCGGIIDGSVNCPDNYSPAPDTADTPNAGIGTDFSDFDGETSTGIWTLCAADSAGGDTGSLTAWTLSINQVVPVELQSFDVE